MSFAMILFFVCVFTGAASFGSAPCTPETCDGTTRARRHAGVMLQKVTATKKVGTSEKEDNEPDGKQYIKLSTRVTTMEARVTKLEEDSSQGRESLKIQLANLTAAVDSMKADGTGSLDDTTSRVSSSEGIVTTLEDTVDTNNAGLRQNVEALRGEYTLLAKNVGEAFASLSALQIAGVREPAVTSAPATAAPPVEVAKTTKAPIVVAAGSGLTGRTTDLEARVAALESASGEEREALKAQIMALDQRVDAIRAGGIGSLDHTTSRVGSAEKQISNLRSHVDESSSSIRADLASLIASVDDLSAKVGLGAAAMLQTKQIQTPSKTLPLTTRVSSLETRIVQLEDKSNQERGTLQVQLDAVSNKVDDIKAGGVASLEHTTLRQNSVETDSSALESYVAEQKESLEAMAATLKTKLANVRASVGASLLEAA